MSKFNRDQFYCFRNRVNWRASKGEHEVETLTFDDMEFTATTYKQVGDVTCEVALFVHVLVGGPATVIEFHCDSMAEVERLLEQHGTIWYG